MGFSHQRVSLQGESLYCEMIVFRPATENDAALLLSWRNDPDTRAASRSMESIEPACHIDWLRSKLSSPVTQILIAEDGGKPVGTVRVDFRGEYSELSWTVSPLARGNGVGTQMLVRAARAIPVRPLRAEIKPGNTASVRMAEKCGFSLLGEVDGLSVYELL
jgi:UDP-2,4-diacetamido-2,4,6-trideoxy-beta-L-altropyranose hydrolase